MGQELGKCRGSEKNQTVRIYRPFIGFQGVRPNFLLDLYPSMARLRLTDLLFGSASPYSNLSVKFQIERPALVDVEPSYSPTRDSRHNLCHVRPS